MEEAKMSIKPQACKASSTANKHEDNNDNKLQPRRKQQQQQPQTTRSKSMTQRRMQVSKMSRRQRSQRLMVCLWNKSALLLVFHWLLIAAFSCMRDDNAGANCAKLPDIYWNSSNPIFRIDNTDHIFDVNKKQHDHDQVDLVCPQPHTAASTESSANGSDASSNMATAANSIQERYIIYSVSKDEYDTCSLRANSGSRVVAVCDQQHGKNRPPYTVTFRSFTPQPNGLEFKAGQDYYFISALIGHEHDQKRRFSPCSEQHMKVIFKVCCKSNAPPAQHQHQQVAGNMRLSLAVPTRAPGASGPKQQSAGGSLSSVITLRPSLALPTQAPAAQTKKQPPAYLELASSQQQQPVTVLPIEDLQPSSTSSASQSSDNNQEQANSSSNNNNNDIQNDGKEPAVSPAPSAPLDGFSSTLADLLVSQQQQQPPRRRLPSSHNGAVPLLPFDPTASPDVLSKNYDRYMPTPLPPAMTRDRQRAHWNSAHLSTSSYSPPQLQQVAVYQQPARTRPQPDGHQHHQWPPAAGNHRGAEQQWSAPTSGAYQQQQQHQWPPARQFPYVSGERNTRGQFYDTYDMRSNPARTLLQQHEPLHRSGAARAHELGPNSLLLLLAACSLAARWLSLATSHRPTTATR